MERLLSELNNAYGAHQAAWANLYDSVRSGAEPSDEVIALLAAAADQQQACLRELLPPKTAIYVGTGSLYSTPDSVRPSRSIDEEVITIHDVSMQLNPQHSHRDIVRSPFAFTSSDESEGIWLQRTMEYHILGSGLRVAFGGLRYEIQRLSSTQQQRMARLYSDSGTPSNTD